MWRPIGGSDRQKPYLRISFPGRFGKLSESENPYPFKHVTNFWRGPPLKPDLINFQSSGLAELYKPFDSFGTKAKGHTFTVSKKVLK